MSQNPTTGTFVNPPPASPSAICGTLGVGLALVSVAAQLLGDVVSPISEVLRSLTLIPALAALVLGGIGLFRREAHPERAGVAVGVGAVAFVTVISAIAQSLAFILLRR